MIFGNIHNLKEVPFLEEKVKECFEYAKSHNLVSYEEGSHEIDGERLFVNIVEYTTTKPEERFWEAHKNYLDVHVMLQGTEQIDLNFIQGIGCNDYDSSVSASQRASTILNNVSDGSIILLHDFQGNSNTVQALPTIIEGLKNQGYTFVTVSQLFQYKGVNPNVEYKIWSNVYN